MSDADWKQLAQDTAASNARLLKLVEEADKLAKACQSGVIFSFRGRHVIRKIELALEDYQIARQGS